MFFIFKYFLFLSVLGLLLTSNAVVCILFLVLVFLNSAVLFLFLGADFLRYRFNSCLCGCYSCFVFICMHDA
jgi:NADH:ubiquinone oxidoreductase subunit 6 (subunit J)